MSGATVHFASLMDICHLKNAELEAKHQKYKGRVVLRGDIVKDNSGSYAVFTEHKSSASLEFCGMGLLPNVLHTDADVARAFCHKREVGRMKQLDVRHCWLHEELEKGNFKVKRVDRKFNASDMLTHSPSAEELRKFLPMIGCHTMTVNRENYNAAKTMLKAMPAVKVTAFLTSLADVVKS